MFNLLRSRDQQTRPTHRLIAARRNTRRYSPHHRPLRCELLEDRRLLCTTWTVENLNDSGAGSLRQAIADAAADDIVEFAQGLTGTLSLQSTLAISKNLTITGLGEGNLTIDGTALSDVFFRIDSGDSLALSGLTMSNGTTGVIDAAGQLSLTGCTFSSNTGAVVSLSSSDSGVSQTITDCTFTTNDSHGTSIILTSGNDAVSIEDCTFSGNLGTHLTKTVSCELTFGNSTITGGVTDVSDGFYLIVNSSLDSENGTTTIVGCTISDNVGCIVNLAGGEYLTVLNSTVADNDAIPSAGDFYTIQNLSEIEEGVATLTIINSTIADNALPGVWQGTATNTVTLYNTIVAGNQDGDVIGGTITASNCLIEDASGVTEIVGDGNITGQDPMLSALGDHGGTTLTKAPLEGSPVINMGSNDFVPECLDTDQRAMARVVNLIVDIGAVEYQIPPTVVTPATATPNPVTGTTAALSVLGDDTLGEETLIYTWSVDSQQASTYNVACPSGPTFSINGTNEAKNTTVTFYAAGDYVFTVKILGETGSWATSSVNVTVDQTFTSVVVCPSSATISVGAKKQFTASARDQFGNGLETQPTFTWTTTAGTISESGQLTAPAQPITGQTVTATSGDLSGTATFKTIIPGPAISKIAVAAPKGIMTWNLCSSYGVKSTSLLVDGRKVTTLYGPFKSASGVNYSANFGTLAVGCHTYVITATDKSNHVSTTTCSFTVTGPTISCVAFALSRNLITWNLYAPVGLKAVSLKIDGQVVAKLYGPYAAACGKNYAAKFSTLLAGTHSYTIKATDSAGRTSTLNGTFAVPTPPVAVPAPKLAAIDAMFASIGKDDDDR
jgi:hypothetical protein